MDILVNFAENGHFGCEMHCPFCVWNEIDYGEYYCPSDEDLDKVIELSKKVVKLSGGGDPLYHFDKNRDKLKHIVDYLVVHDKRVGIYTHDLKTLWKYREELITWPVFFVFSISRQFTALEKQVCEYYAEHGKMRRISTVLNDGYEIPNIDDFKTLLTFCSDRHILTVIRENWRYQYSDRSVLNDFISQLPPYRAYIGFNEGFHRIQVFMHGHVTTCGAIDKTILGL